MTSRRQTWPLNFSRSKNEGGVAKNGQTDGRFVGAFSAQCRFGWCRAASARTVVCREHRPPPARLEAAAQPHTDSQQQKPTKSRALPRTQREAPAKKKTRQRIISSSSSQPASLKDEQRCRYCLRFKRSREKDALVALYLVPSSCTKRNGKIRKGNRSSRQPASQPAILVRYTRQRPAAAAAVASSRGTEYQLQYSLFYFLTKRRRFSPF